MSSPEGTYTLDDVTPEDIGAADALMDLRAESEQILGDAANAQGTDDRGITQDPNGGDVSGDEVAVGERGSTDVEAEESEEESEEGQNTTRTVPPPPPPSKSATGQPTAQAPPPLPLHDGPGADTCGSVLLQGLFWARGQPMMQPLGYRTAADADRGERTLVYGHQVDFDDPESVGKANTRRRTEVLRARKRFGLPMARRDMHDSEIGLVHYDWIAIAHEAYAMLYGGLVPWNTLTLW